MLCSTDFDPISDTTQLITTNNEKFRRGLSRGDAVDAMMSLGGFAEVAKIVLLSIIGPEPHSLRVTFQILFLYK